MIKCWSYITKNDARLDRMMSESKALYDQSLYHIRQAYFKTKDEKKIKTPSYNELWNIVKSEDAYTECSLDIGPKTYAIRQASTNWSSFIKATVAYKKNPSSFTGQPKLPNYLSHKNIEYNIVQVDSSRFRKKNETDNTLNLPCSDYKIKIPKEIRMKDVHQITIQKFYDKTKINIIYEDREVKRNHYDNGSSIGIDLGVNNFCAITSNDKPFSYVVNGRPMKSINQFYNKRLGKIKSELEVCNRTKRSKRLDRLNEKRHNRMNAFIHNVSKKIIDMCVENGVENIIVGHNKGWKQEVEMGRRNNQNFVQIPFNTLINQLQYKSQAYTDLNVIVVEESYTSKTDHMALEDMCHHDRYLGKRITRGLFKSSCGKVINADINGAVGMLRKGNAITDEQLMFLRDRGDGVSPMVLVINP